MTRTSTQKQGSKTDLATPVRRPVVNEEHPLGSAAATHSPDSFMEVQVPAGSPEGHDSGHQARPPAFEGPKTVEEHDHPRRGRRAGPARIPSDLQPGGAVKSLPGLAAARGGSAPVTKMTPRLRTLRYRMIRMTRVLDPAINQSSSSSSASDYSSSESSNSSSDSSIRLFWRLPARPEEWRLLTPRGTR